jgi:hypothetical protein
MSATRTWPVPSVVSGTGGPAGASGVDGESDGSEEKPEHPAKAAPVAANRPASVRRRVSRTTDPMAGKSADKAFSSRRLRAGLTGQRQSVILAAKR